MAQFRSKPFGVTKNGDKVDEYIISNPGGLEISVLNYGCVIKNLFVPTKTGPVDVVVGHDTLADYEADFNSSGSTCCGAFVGRYANRIENAEFSLSGKTYKLEANNGKNHLHGTFPRKIYDVKMFGDTLLMETESPAGEDGFPGNLKVSVRYILTPDNTLRMDYRVSTDEDTIINLTNHTYFNLDGGGNVLGQKLRIYASNYLEGNNETCPTGKILPVDGTPMDFRTGKPLGRDLDTGFYQTTMAGGGFDHCYVLDRPRGASQSLCAWASSDKTGISMKMYTTQPGIQLYTGNFLQNCPSPGKGGVPLEKYGGFALETQHFPCSPSHPEFPTTVLRAGKVFRANTTLRFFTGRQCGRFVSKYQPQQRAALLRELPFADFFGCPLHAFRTKNLCNSSYWQKKMQQKYIFIKEPVLDSRCKKAVSFRQAEHKGSVRSNIWNKRGTGHGYFGFRRRRLHRQPHLHRASECRLRRRRGGQLL